MTGHPFSWPRLSMGHLLDGGWGGGCCDHCNIPEGVTVSSIIWKKERQEQKNRKCDELLYTTHTQMNRGRFFISYWTDDFNHSQVISTDMMHLITLLDPEPLGPDSLCHALLISFSPFLSSIVLTTSPIVRILYQHILTSLHLPAEEGLLEPKKTKRHMTFLSQCYLVCTVICWSVTTTKSVHQIKAGGLWGVS